MIVRKKWILLLRSWPARFGLPAKPANIQPKCFVKKITQIAKVLKIPSVTNL
jgi:hypothetical protein